MTYSSCTFPSSHGCSVVFPTFLSRQPRSPVTQWPCLRGGRRGTVPDLSIKCQLSLPGPWASLSWVHSLITVAPRETHKVSELFYKASLPAVSPPHTLVPPTCSYSGPSTSILTRNHPLPRPLNHLSEQLISTSNQATRHESNTLTHS